MKKVLKIFIISFLILSVVGCATTKNNLKQNNQDEIFIPDVEYTHYELDNGLKIYVIEDHDVSLVKYSLWYKVGSIDETKGITGISHMLEHSMFLGTETLDKNQVHHLIKKAGGTANAGTFYDYTMFHEEVPSAKLELAMAIEADRMNNLKIPEKAFNNENKVVRQERRRTLENNFFRSALEEIQAKAFKKSGLHHQIIGWGEDIENYTAEKARKAHDKYYAPNNAYMIVSGDAKPEKVYKLAKKYFGDYKKSKIKRRSQKEPKQTEERFIKIRKVTRLPVMAMLYKMPKGNHKDIPVINALMSILINNPNSRVKQDLKRNKRLILKAGGFSMGLRIPGMNMIYALPMSEANMDKVKNGIDKHIKDIIKNGVTKKELKTVKKQTLKGVIFSQKDKTNFSRTIASSVVRFDNPELYKKRLKVIKNLTSKDIQRVAKKYFKKQNRTVGYVLPKKN